MKKYLISRPRVRSAIYGVKHLKDFFWHGEFRAPFRLVVEITNRCNLNCETCFWKKEKKGSELSDAQWEKVIDKALKKHPSMLLAGWFGGEPMLRFNLIKKLARKFPWNQVVTNGTLPLQPVKGINYTISIDGTREYHEQQRGKSYEQIKENIAKTKAENISLLYVISRLNQENIEDFCREWAGEKKINRIMFSFYTRNRHKEEDPLWIDLSGQDKIIKKILALSHKYPKIAESARQLQCLSGRKRKKAILNCWQSHKNGSICLDSTGHIKYSTFAKKHGYKVSCESTETDCTCCGVSCVARYKYMADHRYNHFKNVFYRHSPLEKSTEENKP